MKPTAAYYEAVNGLNSFESGGYRHRSVCAGWRRALDPAGHSNKSFRGVHARGGFRDLKNVWHRPWPAWSGVDRLPNIKRGAGENEKT